MLQAWFADPWLLWVAALAPLIFFLHRRVARMRPGFILSSFETLPGTKSRSGAYHLPFVVRLIALLCLVPLLAGLQLPKKPQPRASALIFVLDSSSSMSAEDFPTNRLETVKRLIKEFVGSRTDVEFGLIGFAANPLLLVPVTPDRAAVIKAIDEIRPAGYGEDGTAIGSAIASGVNRLRGVDWRERRIVLITDGVSNRGAISAADAATIAKLMGIVIDAIGIGTNAESRFWVPSGDGTTTELTARIEIDDKALAEVSRITGGDYRRARNSADLHEALRSMTTESAPRKEKDRTAAPWERALAAMALLLLGTEVFVGRWLILELPG